ncbi:hypothetical protein PP178_05715 [Zeaxanthinibacter sp. PT1]|uniref:hypothetical protein n=1 Tax=Zeaxanthinibacter TaxID=561554 RepID=UPI00234BE91A|nr:hypothetical protein [Zeaxanthinibacter sp. PT1]MDC6351042.1 hypothetical protein [Zeaxanthinibacter sp. PT1]
MKQHLLYFLLLPGVALLGSCGLSKHPASYQRDGEEVQLQPLCQAQGQEQEFFDGGALALALAPRLVNLAASSLKTYYEKESEKYVASYGATYVGEDFYADDLSLNVSCKALELRRTVKNSAGAIVPAATIRLQWVSNTEGTLLALLPEYLELAQSKTALRAGDQNADLQISVNLNGWWQDKNGLVKSKTLGEADLQLRDISLGETYRLHGNLNNSYLTDSKGNKSNYNIQSAWMAPVPVSRDHKGERLPNARGNYSLAFTVTETDDFGKRLSHKGQQLYDHRGILMEVLESVLDE